MQSKTTLIQVACVLGTLVLTHLAASAQGPGQGRGRGQGQGHGPGGGGHGPGQGRGMPAEVRETIHGLFDAHSKFQREVKKTKAGYISKTTSKDPAAVKLIQTHVKQMEKRLKAGMMVRRWDPAYEEFVNHYDDIDIKITNIKNGISIVATGKTEDAKKVARNHAGIISKFVKSGWEEHDKLHPAALAKAKVQKEKDNEDAPPAKGKGKAAQNGKSKGKGGKGCCGNCAGDAKAPGKAEGPKGCCGKCAGAAKGNGKGKEDKATAPAKGSEATIKETKDCCKPTAKKAVPAKP